MVQYFAVFLILSFFGGSLGTTTSPQQQTDASKLKDLCQVKKHLETVLLLSRRYYHLLKTTR